MKNQIPRPIATQKQARLKAVAGSKASFHRTTTTTRARARTSEAPGGASRSVSARESRHRQTLVVRETVEPRLVLCRAVMGEEEMKQQPTATLIDGKGIAATIRNEVKEEVAQLKEKYGEDKVPGLAVVLVGSRKDSQTYVRNKKKCCDEVGIVSYGTDLPETATEEEVLEVVEKYNADPRVHGILVQLPLPKHINEEKILTAISIEKDVDGFHPENIGKLAMRGRNPYFVPCTPKGSMELLERMNIPIEGKSAVVVGRSNIVGTPAAMLLQRRNATVTVVHSRTPNPEHYIKNADIVVAACGIANFVQGSWLKPGAAVIDVGINAVDDPTAKRGYRLVGDVDFAEASQVAGAITPVPGGVGPMTIAMLLQNTLEGAKYTFNKEQPNA